MCVIFLKNDRSSIDSNFVEIYEIFSDKYLYYENQRS